MAHHHVASHQEWLAEREKLLEREKAHTRLGDELTRERRELPWVRVEKDYRFETAQGTRTLAELFAGRSQLLVYHFMFGPGWEAGCPVCSSIADNLDANAAHLAARDATLLLCSRAPFQTLRGYRKRMGWKLDWVSSPDGDFNRDLDFLNTVEELQPFLDGDIPVTVEQNARQCGTNVAAYIAERPGLSAYIKSDESVYRTYVTTARGLEPAMGYYGLLDRTPIGRNESASEPLWVRRHDEYERVDSAPARA